MRNITAIIVSRNNTRNLSDTLKSVSDFDEVMVIDCDSNLQTAKLAKSAGATVVSVNFEGEELAFGVHRMIIGAPRNEWVLMLGHGDIVPEGLHAELQRLADNDDGIKGFRLPRKDFILSKFIRCTYPNYALRFFRRDAVHWTRNSLIEPVVDGKTDNIRAEDEHLAIIRPSATVSSTCQRINFLSDVEMEENKERPVSGATLIFSPFFRFVRAYLGKGAWRFGTAGFIQAVFESFHNFTVNAKIYEKRKATSLNQ